ncbi:hypothetical protein [Paenibacillus gansuensis]|uniref:Uncharacterized protein n=1 Tax=Paenibacillus gansuensis TaxID=306542 RepID=A0ABW5P838_9BACL
MRIVTYFVKLCVMIVVFAVLFVLGRDLIFGSWIQLTDQLHQNLLEMAYTFVILIVSLITGHITVDRVGTISS